jgi:hypothetical protein
MNSCKPPECFAFQKIESNPNDKNLRKRKVELAEMVAWLREDAEKRFVKNAMRKMQGKSASDRNSMLRAGCRASTKEGG